MMVFASSFNEALDGQETYAPDTELLNAARRAAAAVRCLRRTRGIAIHTPHVDEIRAMLDDMTGGR
jgi:hypothetical protein